jgi:ADP-heptose:LPS heptosyltransferase
VRSADGRPLLVALRPLGLGDFLTAVPALRALAAAFPGHTRVLAGPSVLAPLAGSTGAVHEVVHTEPLRPLPSTLEDADVAVDLHGRGPASHRVLLAARPQRLIAFENPEIPASAGMPSWRADEHEVDRWCRMLSGHGILADPSDLYLDPPPAEIPGHAVGATLIHPGAASEARRWPPERFAAVAAAEHASGRRVVVTGTREEEPRAQRIAELAGLPAEAALAGRTDLAGLAALVAAAGRVVCGDTGVAHLATAFRIPSVVLFGPVSPRHWGPPAGDPRHRALWAGRTGDPHGSVPDSGLLALTVDDVLQALALLEPRQAAA